MSMSFTPLTQKTMKVDHTMIDLSQRYGAWLLDRECIAIGPENRVRTNPVRDTMGAPTPSIPLILTTAPYASFNSS